MNVISLKRIKEACTKHSKAEKRLMEWHHNMKSNTFNALTELRAVEPSADPIAGTDFTCFDICGNDFRLIVRITWGKTVFVKEFLTHAEYTVKYVKARGKKAGRKR